MAIKRALRLPYTKIISSAGLDAIKSDPVPADEIWCIQRATWETDKATSGGNARSRRYIEGRGYNHNLNEQDAPAASTLYIDVWPVWLIPRERYVIEIDQAQASTTVKMWLTGYRVEFKEGIT